MSRPRDLPFDECVDKALQIMVAGGTVFQKFTCAKCGSRQTMETPNKFYKEGICEECKHITDIAAQGCGYLVRFSI